MWFTVIYTVYIAHVTQTLKKVLFRVETVWIGMIAAIGLPLLMTRTATAGYVTLTASCYHRCDSLITY